MAIYKKATTRYGVSALVRRYVSQAPPERISGQNGPIPMILLIDLHGKIFLVATRRSPSGAPYGRRSGNFSIRFAARTQPSMIRFLSVTLLMLSVVIGGPAGARVALKISLAHNSVTERETRDQLDRLLHKYDLSKWIYTEEIVIDDDAIPHSDPVLTLHTRHLKDDDLLLSTFVHEQMHRFLARRPQEDFDQAKTDLRRLFPEIPVGFPQGSSSNEGNYEHLLVVWLEYRADRELVGELRARQVMEFWAADHYTWIYQKMLDREVMAKISAIIQAHGLVPTA
jgi:hypothetical protein